MSKALEHSTAALFGEDVAVAALPLSGDHPPLWPAEEAAVIRAVPSRRTEFTTGRAAARLALQRLGLPPVAIPAAPDRSPVWPAGITGSISHAAGIAAAVVARYHGAVLGLDIEDPAPLDADLWPLVLTPEEIAALQPLPLDQRGLTAKRIFGIKEAAYKAQFPHTGAVIGFQALKVTLAATEGPHACPDHAIVECTAHGSMIPDLMKLFPKYGQICRMDGPRPETENLLIAAISLPG
jgi:4'-phosphopantetheinyl transferase EntD